MIANGRNGLKLLFDLLKRFLVGVSGVDFGEKAKEEVEALVTPQGSNRVKWTIRGMSLNNDASRARAGTSDNAAPYGALSWRG